MAGRPIIYLHMRHQEALGSKKFIALGLIAPTYGLALLRVSANCLGALPDWLLHMPRLAWLACAAQEGQPTSAATDEQPGDIA